MLAADVVAPIQAQHVIRAELKQACFAFLRKNRIKKPFLRIKIKSTASYFDVVAI